MVGCKCDFTIEVVKKFWVAKRQEIFGGMNSVLSTLKNCLILDSLMLINMNSKATEEELLFIAEVATLFKYKMQDFSIIVQLANELLEMNEDKFYKIIAKKSFANLNYLIPIKWL